MFVWQICDIGLDFFNGCGVVQYFFWGIIVEGIEIKVNFKNSGILFINCMDIWFWWYIGSIQFFGFYSFEVEYVEQAIYLFC